MGGKGQSKRKKDPNSPDTDIEKPGQKRVTMDNSQQQPQASAGGLFFPYGQAMPGMPFMHPYYGSPPPPPSTPQMSQSQYTTMASAIPLPKSPDELGSPMGAMSQGILSKILARLDIMDTKLGQLDTIQSQLTKVTVDVSTMSTKVLGMEKQLTDLEASRNFDTQTLDSIQGKQNEIDKMLKKIQKVEEEQKEKLLDLQCREMRDNLIFYGIDEEKDETDKDCINKVLNLVEEKLKVPFAKQIPIHRAHRMGRFQRNKTRPIVAKFAYYPNREDIRKAAKNLEGTQYSIGQQFPKEIQDRRRELVPLLKEARHKGQKAHIAVDKLYIDGKLHQAAEKKPSSTSAGAASTSSTSGTVNSNRPPHPGGARGFNVLPNEAEA